MTSVLFLRNCRLIALPQNLSPELVELLVLRLQVMGIETIERGALTEVHELKHLHKSLVVNSDVALAVVLEDKYPPSVSVLVDQGIVPEEVVGMDQELPPHVIGKHTRNRNGHSDDLGHWVELLTFSHGSSKSQVEKFFLNIGKTLQQNNIIKKWLCQQKYLQNIDIYRNIVWKKNYFYWFF